jgi:hypothetical protein
MDKLKQAVALAGFSSEKYLKFSVEQNFKWSALNEPVHIQAEIFSRIGPNRTSLSDHC